MWEVSVWMITTTATNHRSWFVTEGTQYNM